MLVYFAAVVGPTLVVLTLGVIAAARQHQAVETLAAVNRRLFEARVADEVDRAIQTEAEAVLQDGRLSDLVPGLISDNPVVVDAARVELERLISRHPIVDEVFVASRRGLVFPPVHPPLPKRLEDALRGEAKQAELLGLFDRARTVEADGDYRSAVAAYERIRIVARERRVIGLALSGEGRARLAAGDRAGAARTWTTLASHYDDAYSLSGRPFAALSAVELGMMAGPSEVVSRVRHSIVAGRWSLTPEQAAYFLSSLPGAESLTRSPYLDSLAFARRLQAVLAGEPLPDTVTTARATIAVDGTVDDIFFKPQSPGLAIGISTDLEYVRTHIILDAASRAAPGVAVEIHAETPQKSAFRTRSPVWRFSVPPASSVSVWRRADLLMFVAGTVVVLGVLVLGVVLLARDVARDTSVNRMRADLVSGVSHELKTPLSVIRVYAEMLEDSADASQGDRRHFAAAIVQETDRLKRLINDVVDFSRIQQGERVYPMTAGSIVEVITLAAERFRSYAELHGFTLNANIGVVNHAVVFDPVAVEQATLNLLDNALKYSGDATRIDLRVFERDSHIVVEVEDYGVGIAAEDQMRIFERFHRGAHVDRGGYGLGLYLVRHIMDAHGGDVRVESVRGQGSRFSLRFPIVPEGQHAKSLAG